MKITSKKEKKLEQLHRDLFELQHVICCQVEILMRADYDAPTIRARLAKMIQEWNIIGYDYCSAIDEAD